jgi:hypothetical protein
MSTWMIYGYLGCGTQNGSTEQKQSLQCILQVANARDMSTRQASGCEEGGGIFSTQICRRLGLKNHPRCLAALVCLKAGLEELGET